MENLILIGLGLLILTGWLMSRQGQPALCLITRHPDDGQKLNTGWLIAEYSTSWRSTEYSTNSITGGTYSGNSCSANEPSRKKELSAEEKKELEKERAELERRIELLELIEGALNPKEKLNQFKRSAHDKVEDIKRKLNS